jgi:hypothetical protein
MPTDTLSVLNNSGDYNSICTSPERRWKENIVALPHAGESSVISEE